VEREAIEARDLAPRRLEERVEDLGIAHIADEVEVVGMACAEEHHPPVLLVERRKRDRPAVALGEDQGLVKVVFDKKTGQLLGAHMIGAEVTELIQGFVIAMQLETTEEDLMHTVFPHPTLSEMMHESTLDAYGRVIHM